MIIGLLGGIMMPSVPPVDDAAAANERSYPTLIIAGIISVPIAATVAGPEPDIAAKNMQARIVTHAKPPVTCPINADAKSTRRCERPPYSIKYPASTKNGTATSGNESDELNVVCGTNTAGMPCA